MEVRVLSGVQARLGYRRTVQLHEQDVVRSTLTRAIQGVAQLEERRFGEPEVAGSDPATLTHAPVV